MAKPADTIETKAKAMAKAMNDAIAARRDARIAELKKAAKAAAGKPGKPGAPAAAADPDKTLWRVEMRVSKSKITHKRSPEQQALSCAKGTSWTCASAHMLDMARHVDLHVAAPGKTSLKITWTPENPFGTGDEHFMTFAEWKAEWNKAMKAQDLRNYEGGTSFAAKDAYHVELPESRVPHSASEVQACMKEYVRLTRQEGHKPNSKFENSSAWKADLKPHIDAIEAEQKKAQEEKRLEGLRKMRLDGSLARKVKVGRAISKSAKLAPVPIGDILPPSPIDAGAGKVRRMVGTAEASWDSLARALVEKLGLRPTSGFDVKVVCGVSYEAISYQNLTQDFLSGLKVWAEVIYNTPVARFCKIDIDANVQVALKTADAAAKGSVLFDIRLTTPVQKLAGSVTLKIDRAGVTGSVKAG